MIRIAKKTDPIRIAELKQKIHDQAYLSQAISRIALVITRELLQIDKE